MSSHERGPLSWSEERSALTLQLIEDGTLLQYFERDLAASSAHEERLYQLQRLKKAETRLPRGEIVIINGLQDTLVPSKLSERFVKAARQQLKCRQGVDRIVLSHQEGGNGFDTDVDLEESWLQEALRTRYIYVVGVTFQPYAKMKHTEAIICIVMYIMNILLTSWLLA